MDNMEAAVSKNELRHGVKGKNHAFSGGPSMSPGAALALPTATWCQTTANATPALPCFQDALTNSLASLWYTRASTSKQHWLHQASNHQSYSQHITHPSHFLSCLAADLLQRQLKGALMVFVSPLCLAAIKIESMPPPLSSPFFFFSCILPHHHCGLWTVIYHRIDQAAGSWEQ